MSEKTVFSEPTWAIVELFGHNVVAGQVAEVTIAGAPMLRVDVPDVLDGEGNVDQFGFTKFFGGAAIYGITPVTKDAAKEAVDRLRIRPVRAWIVPESKPQLPAPEDDEDPFSEPPF